MMNQPVKKRLCIGLLAHVDAGKTTLSESMLYLTGAIRKMGRVDHQDAFLDTDAMERTRGITIFSKQAELQLQDTAVTLLDTPGHVDFSAEMERTLQVLDYAILIISGADGVQGHTATLWKLLKRYRVPVFLFVNKMDLPAADKNDRMREIKERLSDSCLDFSTQDDAFFENLALCDEALMEAYVGGKRPADTEIAEAIRRRTVFPCYFGSALKTNGVLELLRGIETYTLMPAYRKEFGAKVYKITRDRQNQRLTHMKITGGTLAVKDFLSGRNRDDAMWSEKIDQIRVYSGSGFSTRSEAPAGTVCAVTGLTETYSGEGLGAEQESELPLLEPVLTYRILLPPGYDSHTMLLQLRQMEEEEPQLNIVWEEETQEIHAQVMGEIEIEILKGKIAERFGVPVEFGAGSLIYKETIAAPVEGVGHFEPLRHYAEVHLLLEPGERGSGLAFDTLCGEDVLARNWQRLVLTHLEEKRHRGVLIGAEITDMKISLLTGRAHIKHTEGGDFRQATYRAVRQGLMKAHSVLLEPVYEFRLEIPSDMLGRALADIQKMYGKCESSETRGAVSILKGQAPVSTMREYQKEVTAYSRGTGRLFCTLKGYEPCHNPEEVLAQNPYDPNADLANPTGSVFCAHGAGFTVPWDQVETYMHLESPLRTGNGSADPLLPAREGAEGPPLSAEEEAAGSSRTGNEAAGPPQTLSRAEEKELEEIFVRTYGAIQRDRNRFSRNKIREAIEEAKSRKESPANEPERERYLLVDGYNILFAWDDLKKLAADSLDAARGALMDILSNYQGFRQDHVILIFDAYKVKDNPGTVQKYGGISVIYTKEAETADQYIEKTVHEIGRRYDVTVATSDSMEQLIIWGEGAMRMSAAELREEIEAVNIQIRDAITRRNGKEKNRPLEGLLAKQTENPEAKEQDGQKHGNL